MITWKTIRYGHLEELREMKTKIADKELNDRDATLFILSFVLEWDFVDADTRQSLEPTAPETLDLLSMPQYKELCGAFNEQVGVKAVVPKANASGSRSGSTASKPAKDRKQSRPAG